jgi:5-methylcytosine-specific restriction protein A
MIRSEIRRTSRLESSPGPVRRSRLGRNVPLRASRAPLAAREAKPKGKSAARRKGGTGSGKFTRKVRLQCRTRAGNGDPDNARCECCGCFLGRREGQVQHRLARGSGGSGNPVVASLANAALLCGTAQTLCHGDAESRDPARDMEATGFVIRHGAGPAFDPRYVPIALSSQFGSGMTVWLSEAAPEYLYAPPGAVAA